MSQHVRHVSILCLRPQTAGLHPVRVESVGRVQEEVRVGAYFAVQEHQTAPKNPECTGCHIVEFILVLQVQEPDLSPGSPLPQCGHRAVWWEPGRRGREGDLGLVRQQPRLDHITISLPGFVSL